MEWIHENDIPEQKNPLPQQNSSTQFEGRFQHTNDILSKIKEKEEEEREDPDMYLKNALSTPNEKDIGDRLLGTLKKLNESTIWEKEKAVLKSMIQ